MKEKEKDVKKAIGWALREITKKIYLFLSFYRNGPWLRIKTRSG
jgi:hypothetical protein